MTPAKAATFLDGLMVNRCLALKKVAFLKAAYGARSSASTASSQLEVAVLTQTTVDEQISDFKSQVYWEILRILTLDDEPGLLEEMKKQAIAYVLDQVPQLVLDAIPFIGVATSTAKAVVSAYKAAKAHSAIVTTTRAAVQLNNRNASALCNSLKELLERSRNEEGINAAIRAAAAGAKLASTLDVSQLGAALSAAGEAILVGAMLVRSVIVDLQYLKVGNEVLEAGNLGLDALSACPLLACHALVHGDTSWILGLSLQTMGPLTTDKETEILALNTHIEKLRSRAEKMIGLSRLEITLTSEAAKIARENELLYRKVDRIINEDWVQLPSKRMFKDETNRRGQFRPQALQDIDTALDKWAANGNKQENRLAILEEILGLCEIATEPRAMAASRLGGVAKLWEVVEEEIERTKVYAAVDGNRVTKFITPIEDPFRPRT